MDNKSNKKATRRTGGFWIKEFPHQSSKITVNGKEYIVKVVLIHISSTSKNDFTYLYEGTVKIGKKPITCSDFTIEKMLYKLKKDILEHIKKGK